MSKQPTPQGISALLRKAGFDKSVSSSTRIKGWREWTEGFKVTKRFDGTAVEVEYRPSSFRLRETSDEQIAAMLDRYAKTIEAAGFKTAKDSTIARAFLIVTATDPDAEEAGS